jgi:hypothetical protein
MNMSFTLFISHPDHHDVDAIKERENHMTPKNNSSNPHSGERLNFL